MWLVATVLDIDIEHFKDIKHFHHAKRSPGTQNEMNNSTQYLGCWQISISYMTDGI